MKIRNDFVSNSSSSSFIVWKLGNDEIELKNKNILIDLYNNSFEETWDETSCSYSRTLPNYSIGNCAFGWEEVEYKSIGDKINFCALQCYYKSDSGNVEDSEWWDLLMTALSYILDISKSELNIKFNFKECDYYAYIDHQSNAREGCNIEMFDSLRDLMLFLLSDSYIQGGNDN